MTLKKYRDVNNQRDVHFCVSPFSSIYGTAAKYGYSYFAEAIVTYSSVR